MTDEEHLTLEQVAGAVGMTTRNVRAYQTRGLLQPPRRVGRTSVYGGDHVRRLRQVQRARARGASLALLRTLIREGRDLDGVWEGRDGPARAEVADTVDVVDVRSSALGHTAACMARLDVPLPPLLEALGGGGDPSVQPAVAGLIGAGVLRSEGGEVLVPGSLACAAGALHGQGLLGPAGAVLRLTQLVAEAAEAVAAAVAGAVRSMDADARRAGAERFGELAAGVTGEVVTARLAAYDEAPAG